MKRKIEEVQEIRDRKQAEHKATMEELEHRLALTKQELAKLQASIGTNNQILEHYRPMAEIYPGIFGNKFELSPEELRGRVVALNAKVKELALHTVQEFSATAPSQINAEDDLFRDKEILSESFISDLNKLRGAPHGYPEQAAVALRAAMVWFGYTYAKAWYISNPVLNEKFERIAIELNDAGLPTARFWASKTNKSLRDAEGPKALEFLVEELSGLIVRVLSILGWDAKARFAQDVKFQTSVDDRALEIGEMILGLNGLAREDQRAGVNFKWYEGGSELNEEDMEFEPAMVRDNLVSCTTALGFAMQKMSRPIIAMKAEVM
ncbi:hypothetical protein AX16_005061 [Volvariella volvacea WC 439]|nr:hypothetical protein AX16_005061 [Volvariella volvacea WC 439]